MKRKGRGNPFLILLVFILLFSSITLTSCNRKYDENEVVNATKTLLEQAKILNKVYYGSGIEYYDTEENGMGYYRKAKKEHLDELGFSTIDELKVITEKTFSDGYSNTIYNTILSPIRDDTSLISAVRYYQAEDEETKESYIMVRASFIPLFKDSVEYDYNTVRVEKVKKEKVYLEVDATVTNSEGKTQNITITVVLVEEDDGWRIDNPVYANYDEQKDRYDELKNHNIK